jgi:hypothetical protein
MKYILLTVLLAPAIGFAQTKADYEHAIKRFVGFYNKGQGDSIGYMWDPSLRVKLGGWSKEHMQELHKKYGKITSYKYLGVDKDDPNPGLAVFVTKFAKEKEETTTSFTLDKKNQFETFRLITSSDGIDKLKATKK